MYKLMRHHRVKILQQVAEEWATVVNSAGRGENGELAQDKHGTANRYKRR